MQALSQNTKVYFGEKIPTTLYVACAYDLRPCSATRDQGCCAAVSSVLPRQRPRDIVCALRTLLLPPSWRHFPVTLNPSVVACCFFMNAFGCCAVCRQPLSWGVRFAKQHRKFVHFSKFKLHDTVASTDTLCQCASAPMRCAPSLTNPEPHRIF